MKKRVLSMLLALTMVLTMVPSTAFATEETDTQEPTASVVVSDYTIDDDTQVQEVTQAQNIIVPASWASQNPVYIDRDMEAPTAPVANAIPMMARASVYSAEPVGETGGAFHLRKLLAADNDSIPSSKKFLTAFSPYNEDEGYHKVVDQASVSVQLLSSSVNCTYEVYVNGHYIYEITIPASELDTNIVCHMRDSYLNDAFNWVTIKVTQGQATFEHIAVHKNGGDTGHEVDFFNVNSIKVHDASKDGEITFKNTIAPSATSGNRYHTFFDVYCEDAVTPYSQTYTSTPGDYYKTISLPRSAEDYKINCMVFIENSKGEITGSESISYYIYSGKVIYMQATHSVGTQTAVGLPIAITPTFFTDFDVTSVQATLDDESVIDFTKSGSNYVHTLTPAQYHEVGFNGLNVTFTFSDDGSYTYTIDKDDLEMDADPPDIRSSSKTYYTYVTDPSKNMKKADIETELKATISIQDDNWDGNYTFQAVNPVNPDDVGSYEYQITATDDFGLTETDSIYAHIVNAPVELGDVTVKNNFTFAAPIIEQGSSDGTVKYVIGYGSAPTVADHVATVTDGAFSPIAHVQYYVRGYLTDKDGVVHYTEAEAFSDGDVMNFGTLTAEDVAVQYNYYDSTEIQSFSLPVTRNDGSEGSVTVKYAVTATGTDAKVTLTSGTLTFAADETTQNIPFTINDRGAFTGTRYVEVTLSNPTPTTINGSSTSSTVRIDYSTNNKAEYVTEDKTSSASSSGNNSITWTGESVSHSADSAASPPVFQPYYTYDSTINLGNWDKAQAMTVTVKYNTASKARMDGSEVDTDFLGTKASTTTYTPSRGGVDEAEGVSTGAITATSTNNTYTYTFNANGTGTENRKIKLVTKVNNPTLTEYPKITITSVNISYTVTPAFTFEGFWCNTARTYYPGDQIVVYPLASHKINPDTITASLPVTCNDKAFALTYSKTVGGYVGTIPTDLTVSGSCTTTSDITVKTDGSYDKSDNVPAGTSIGDLTIGTSVSVTSKVTFDTKDKTLPVHTATVGSGVEYVWSTSPTAPGTGWTKVSADGTTVKGAGYDGTMYLHVKYTDTNSGETSYDKQAYTFKQPSFALNGTTGTAWMTENAVVTWTADASTNAPLTITVNGEMVTGTSYTITQSGLYKFTATDDYGFIKTQDVIVNIDAVAPTIQANTDVYEVDESYENITVPLTFDDEGGSSLASYGWAFGPNESYGGSYNSGEIATYTASDTTRTKVYLHVFATDGAGNKTTAVYPFYVAKIDDAATPPTLALSSDGTDITYTINKGTYDLAYVSAGNTSTFNGTFPAKNGLNTFTVVDTAGNQVTETLVVNSPTLDKDAPSVTTTVTANQSTYDPSVYNNKLTVTITANDDVTKFYDANGEVDPDQAYGSGIASVTYQKGGGEVVSLNPVDGKYTFDTTENGTYTITVTDAQGNVTTDTVVVNNIDTAPPIVETVSATTTDWTNEDVTVTISASDDHSGLGEKPYSFDGGKTWQSSNQMTYTENTDDVEIWVKDNLGNITKRTAQAITCIDKTAPTASGIEDGKAYYGDTTFTVDDDASSVDSVTIDDVTVSSPYSITPDNGSHTVVITDTAGNETTLVITVMKIYDVTFVANGGSAVTALEVNHGDTITVPTTILLGYTLDGWYHGTEKLTDQTTITADVDYTAKWTLNAPTADDLTDIDQAYIGGNYTATVVPSNDVTVDYTYTWSKVGDATFTHDTATLTVSTVAHSGVYQVEVTATDSAGLTSTLTKPVTVSIAKAQVLFAYSPSTYTYDGAQQTADDDISATWGSESANFTAYTLTYDATPQNAGSYTVTATLNDDSNHYVGNQNNTDTAVNAYTFTSKHTIGQAPLTPTSATITAGKIYDGTTDLDPQGTIAYSGEIGSEAPVLSGTYTWTSKDAGTSTYAVSDITLTDAAVNQNYKIVDGFTGLTNQTTETYAIGKIRLVPTIVGQDKIYDGTVTASATLTLTPATDYVAVIGEAPQATATYTFDDADVEDATTVSTSDIALTSDWTTNYELTTDQANDLANITVKSVAVVWADETAEYTYSGADQSDSITASYVDVNEQSVDLTVAYDRQSSEETAFHHAGTYDLTADFETPDTNYTLTNTTVFDVVLGQYTATVVWVNDDSAHTYDATVQNTNITATFAGLGTDGTISLDVAYLGNGTSNTGDADFKSVGEYELTATIPVADTTSVNDYTLTNATTTATMTPKTITATWSDTNQTYTGEALSPTITFDGVETDDLGAVNNTATTTAVSSGTLTIQLDNPNYVVSDDTASRTFTVSKIPVTITVETNYNPIGSVTGADFSTDPVAAEGDIILSYYNSRGELVSDITTAVPGTYTMVATLQDQSYTFNGSVGNTIALGNFVIATVAPAKHTVAFDEGTTYNLDAAHSGTVHILPDTTATKLGSVFAGWLYRDILYKADSAFVQPNMAVELEAQWAALHDVAGTITDKDGLSIPGATVTLTQSGTTIDSDTTDANGAYTVTAPDGSYLITAEISGITTTQPIAIVDGVIIGNPNIQIKAYSVKVTVEEGIPVSTVQGLHAVADASNDAVAGDSTKALTQVELIVSTATDPVAEAAIAEAVKNVAFYMDFTIQKTITTPIGEEITTITDTGDQLIEITLNFPAEIQGKTSYKIYRVHDGEVQTITTAKNQWNEYVKFNEDKTQITLCVCKFSTYALAYSTSSGFGFSYPSSVTTAQNGTVALSSTKSQLNSIVTITPTPDVGYQVGTVTVTSDSGRNIKVTDNGDGTYSYKQPGTSVTVTVTFVKTASETSFTDVSEEDWFYDAVQWAVSADVTTGKSTTHFAPWDINTRAEAVTFLYRAMGAPEHGEGCDFTDIAANYFYYEAVLWAVEEGITIGTSDTTFSPDMTCTRAQIITLLWRMMGKPMADAANPFADIALDDYYHSAVLWAVSQGITDGTSDTTFSPNQDCTRAEIVTFLYRTLGN